MSINGEGYPVSDGSSSSPTVAPAPSGTSSTSAAAAVSSPGLGQQLAGVGTDTFALLMGPNGIPVQASGRSVLPTEVVEITPIPTNTVNAFTANTPEAAKNGPNRGYWPPTGQPRIISVRRLNEIWLYSTVQGEGVLVQVRPK